MTPREIIEKLGIEVVSNPEGPVETLGSPPTHNACIVRIAGKLMVEVRDESDDAMIDGIHEALHLVNGPKSFEDELSSGLMAAEWAVCQELDRPAYGIWRRVFAEYDLHAIKIGDTDDFLDTDEWIDGEIDATCNGLLDDAGEPIWSLGPHADFSGG